MRSALKHGNFCAAGATNLVAVGDLSFASVANAASAASLTESFRFLQKMGEWVAQIYEKEKQKRMKKELTFARDSSITLPRVDPLFKIQVNDFNLILWVTFRVEFTIGIWPLWPVSRSNVARTRGHAVRVWPPAP